jgi:hypothetical protein
MVSILDSIGGVALVKLDNWRNRLWPAAGEIATPSGDDVWVMSHKRGEWYDELDFLCRPPAWA